MRAGEDDVVPLHQAFDVGFRGFRRRQVLEHVESLEGQLAMMSADRDDALEQAATLRKLLEHVRVECEEAHARVERLENAPASMGGTSERLHRMLLLAEAETTELRRRAEQDVAGLRRGAAEEAAALRTQAEQEAAALRKRTEEEAAALRARAEREATELRAAAERETAELRAGCARLATELEQQRDRLMEEHSARVRRFDEEQRAKRQEIAERHRVTVAEARTEAERLRRDAAAACAALEAESEARRADAQRRHDEALARQREETARDRARREEESMLRAALLLHLVAQDSRRRVELADRTGAEVAALQAELTARLRAVQAAVAGAVDEVDRPLRVEAVRVTEGAVRTNGSAPAHLAASA